MFFYPFFDDFECRDTEGNLLRAGKRFLTKQSSCNQNSYISLKTSLQIFFPGGNPSIHWNKYLKLWMMVYHGWDGNIYLTTARE